MRRPRRAMSGRGLEPLRPCGHAGLSGARLPVSPPGRFAYTPWLLADVPAAIRWRLTVTIWTEKAQVLEPIVGIIAVDVIQVQGERAPAPVAQTAQSTTVGEQSCLDQPPLERAPARTGTVAHQNCVERPCLNHGRRTAASPPDSLPMRRVEPESPDGKPNRSVVPAGWNATQGSQRVCHTPAAGDSRAEGVFRPCRLRSA